MQCAQFPDSETRQKGVKEEGKCLRDVPLKVPVHVTDAWLSQQRSVNSKRQVESLLPTNVPLQVPSESSEEKMFMKSCQIPSESLVFKKASQEKSEQSVPTSTCDVVMLFNKRLSRFHYVWLISLFEAVFDKSR